MENPSQSEPDSGHETPTGAGSTGQPASSPWLVRGVEDVYYQREAQLGLWTILGGIAVGALVTQMQSVAAQVQAGRWSVALYFLATVLIIANAWVQTAWGPLVIRWRLCVAMALLHISGGLATCVLSLQVTNPPGWMFAVGLLVLITQIIQLYHTRSGAWGVFDPAYTARLKSVLWTQGTFMGIALAAGLLLLHYPGPLHETVWGVVAVLLAGLALWLQDRGMKAERAALGIP